MDNTLNTFEVNATYKVTDEVILLDGLSLQVVGIITCIGIFGSSQNIIKYFVEWFDKNAVKNSSWFENYQLKPVETGNDDNAADKLNEDLKAVSGEDQPAV